MSGSGNSRQIRFHKFGPPEVLQVDKQPQPHPASGDALIRVEASGVNWRDVDQRRGTYGIDISLPYCPGCDVVGTVEEVGRSGDRSLVGQKVIIYPTLSCGTCSACLAGEDNRCRQTTMALSGGYADFIVVPAKNLVPIHPDTDSVSFAALPTAYLTAWHALITLANLTPGDVVLITGASGGVAVAATKIAELVEARCLLVTRSPERFRSNNHDLHQIDVFPFDDNIVEYALEATGGKGVDVVFDALGGAALTDLIQTLRPGGTLLPYGWLLGSTATLPLPLLNRQEIMLAGSRLGNRGEFDRLLNMAQSGALLPTVDRVFPLEDAAKAHHFMEEGGPMGKVVLVP